MSWHVAARLSGTPELWRGVRHCGEVVEFQSEAEAAHWMRTRFPQTLNGVHVRCDMFHGLQPLRVVAGKGQA